MTRSTLFLLEVLPTGRILAFDPDTGKERVLIDNLSSHPDGICLDPAGRSLFYSTMGRVKEEQSLEFFQADGTINRLSFDGKRHEELVGHGLFVTGKQMVLDAPDQTLYWCDREGMRVLRHDLRTNATEVLVQTGLFPRDSHDYTRHCVGIALDPAQNHLYWTQKGPSKGGKGRILRTMLKRDSPQKAESRHDIVTMLDHLPEPIDLELDAKNNRLYWTDRGNSKKGGNSLNCARIDNERLVDHKILATGLEEAIGLAADFEESLIYLTDLGGNLWRYDLQKGGALKKLAQFGPLTGIALLKE